MGKFMEGTRQQTMKDLIDPNEFIIVLPETAWDGQQLGFLNKEQIQQVIRLGEAFVRFGGASDRVCATLRHARRLQHT